MDHWDCATSCVKKKRNKTFVVWSSSNALDVYGSPSVNFNLSCYKSLDERVRLNHFKMIHWWTITRHVSPSLSENQWLQGMGKYWLVLGQPDRTRTFDPSKWAFHSLGPCSVLDRVEKKLPWQFFCRFWRSCSAAVLVIPRSGGFAVLVIPRGGFSVLVTSQDLQTIFYISNFLYYEFLFTLYPPLCF